MMHTFSHSSRTVFATLVHLAVAGIAFAAPRIAMGQAPSPAVHYTESPFIKRFDPSQPLAPVIVGPAMSDPEGLAFDHAGHQIYVADDNTKKVHRMGIDGSSFQDVVTGLAGLTSVAIDPIGRAAFFSDEGRGKIQMVSLDAPALPASPIDIVTGIPQVQGIALDVRNRRVYWADFAAGVIRSADIRGTNLDIRDVTLASQPVDVDVDAAACKVWWTDRGSNSVKRVSLETGVVETVVSNTAPALAGIGLDKRASPATVYWVDNNNHQLARADMDPPDSNVNSALVQLAVDKGFDVAVLRLDDSDGDGIPNGLPSPVDLFQCDAAAAAESFSPAEGRFRHDPVRGLLAAGFRS